MAHNPNGPILLTGASGFVGRWLSQRFSDLDAGRRLVLTDRQAKTIPAGDVMALDGADPDAVEAIIARVQPAAVVHFAAIAAVQSSYADPRATWTVNTLGALNVVLAMLKHAPRARLLFVSSAEVYGKSAFCAQVARIEQGLQPPVLEVGELDDEREFLHVRDVVDLYLRILDPQAQFAPRLVLNAASGAPIKVRALVDRLRALSSTPFDVRIDPQRLRAARVPRIVGDATRALSVLGWAPTTGFEVTVEEVLEHERRTVRGAGQVSP